MQFGCSAFPPITSFYNTIWRNSYPFKPFFSFLKCNFINFIKIIYKKNKKKINKQEEKFWKNENQGKTKIKVQKEKITEKEWLISFFGTHIDKNTLNYFKINNSVHYFQTQYNSNWQIPKSKVSFLSVSYKESKTSSQI